MGLFEVKVMNAETEILKGMWLNHKAEIYANFIKEKRDLGPELNVEWFCDNDGFYSIVETLPGAAALEKVWCSHGMSPEANTYIAMIWLRVATQLREPQYTNLIDHLLKVELEGL